MRHADVVLGSLAGVTGGTALATDPIANLPPGAPWWAGWVGALLITLVPVVVKAVVEGVNSKRKARTEVKK